MRGIEDFIKKDKILAEKINWAGLIKLFLNIKKSSEEKTFENKKEEIDFHDGWLSNWTDVHDAMADVFQLLLKEDQNYKTIIDFKKYRDDLFTILKYLLKYRDPIPEDEEKETATSTTNNQVTDPFTMAINSVRGRAFQGLMFFLYPDGRISKDKVIIKDDVKKIYEEILDKEDTKALMFMFGHYLPSFYFRDIKWIQGLLPKIFPRKEDSKFLFLSAWEGYLSNNLYREIFTDSNFRELYFHALSVDIDDSGRRYFRDPDDGIAIHLALAFMYYEDFGFDHLLFKKFWGKNDPELHSHFVNFIGRSFISNDNISINDFFKKESHGKKRIIELWDWLLDNCNEQKVFESFGFWINTDKGLFNPKWLAEHIRKTLEITDGLLEWDYGLKKVISNLSMESPKNVLEIMKLIFLKDCVKVSHLSGSFYFEDDWVETFKKLYDNPITKLDTEELINNLIRDGGRPFWGLKKILN